MIRTFLLAATMALIVGNTAQADGFEPGREPSYGGPKLHRAIHHRRQHHVYGQVPRHSSGRVFVGGAEPGRLTNNFNIPIYNIPPRRFP